MSKSISPEIKDLAAKIKDGLTFQDGRISVDPETYVSTLPEGMTKESVKALHDHNSHFYSAATLAVGEMAIEHMKKDKKLEAVEASVPLYGKDTFDLTIERSRTFANPQDKDKPTTTYANVKATLVTQSARAARGTMNQVRQELAASALAAFGSK